MNHWASGNQALEATASLGAPHLCSPVRRRSHHKSTVAGELCITHILVMTIEDFYALAISPDPCGVVSCGCEDHAPRVGREYSSVYFISMSLKHLYAPTCRY